MQNTILSNSNSLTNYLYNNVNVGTVLACASIIPLLAYDYFRKDAIISCKKVMKGTKLVQSQFTEMSRRILDRAFLSEDERRLKLLFQVLQKDSPSQAELQMLHRSIENYHLPLKNIFEVVDDIIPCQ